MNHTQPEPFTYTDPDGDMLTIATTTRFGSTALSLRVQRPDVPEAAAAVHVPLADVERVVAAIRTAAGAVQPDTTTADKAAALGMTPDEYRQHRHQAAVKQIQEAAKGLLAETGLRVMDALEHPVAAGAQQPEPGPAVWTACGPDQVDETTEGDEQQPEAEERRERTEPWGEVSGEFGTARQEINRLGSENARLRSQLDALREVSRQQNVRLRAELEQARELLDDHRETERDHAKGDHGYCGAECEVEMPSEHLRNFILAKGYPGTGGALDELLRRAGQARGTTGQDTTPPAEGEQEIRQQIARELDRLCEIGAVYSLDDAERRRITDAVLPVVRAAVTAGARRALEGVDGLPDRLGAVLTERFTELGNPFSAMRRNYQGPDGWPASDPVSPNEVAEVLRELLTTEPAAPPREQGGPSA